MGWKYFILLLSLFLLISCTAQQEHISAQAAPNQVKNVDVLKNGNTSGIEAQEVNYVQAIGFLAKPKEEGIYLLDKNKKIKLNGGD